MFSEQVILGFYAGDFFSFLPSEYLLGALCLIALILGLSIALRKKDASFHASMEVGDWNFRSL